MTTSFSKRSPAAEWVWSTEPGRRASHVVDLVGDQRDELLWTFETKLRAVSGDLSKVVWEWEMPDSDSGVAEILPATGDHPATVAIYSARSIGPTARKHDLALGYSSVIGLDGATARPEWQADLSTLNVPELLARPVSGLPLVASIRRDLMTPASLAASEPLTFDSEGRYALPAATRPQEVALPADPRLSRTV